jgi:hypothetical protein
MREQTMTDFDAKELRALARRTANELHIIVKTSNADNARHLAWRPVRGVAGGSAPCACQS